MLGQIVKRLREEKGWTPSDLADEANLELDFVLAIESIDDARAEPGDLAKLARALDVFPAVLATQWASVPGEGRFRDLLVPLVEFISSPSGMDAFRVDRSFDKLSSEVVEVFDEGGPMRRAKLESFAAALTDLQSAPIVQTRAHALATFIRGLLVATEAAPPNMEPTASRELANTLVASALDDGMSKSDFNALFERTTYLLAGWFVHRPGAYADCVRAFALERTELGYAALEGRGGTFGGLERQHVVSGLTSILGTVLVASALAHA